MTDSSPATEDCLQSPPRLPLTYPNFTEFSYADLIEAHAATSGLPLLDTDEAEKEQHRYPAILQSLITRLETCGRLANTRSIARHSNKNKKSEPDDRFYDLDDGFIEEEEWDKENEGDFQTAVEEGHYILHSLDLLSCTTQSCLGGKRKAQDLSAYPDCIRKILVELDSLYMSSQKTKPKGAGKLMTSALCLMLKNTDSTVVIDRVDLCLTLSEISGFSLGKIEALAEKLATRQQLAMVIAIHQTNIKRLKAGITVECRSTVPAWTQELQASYQSCLDSLEQMVARTNDLNKIRNRPLVTVAEEEMKLEKEVETWSDRRFCMDQRQISVILLERPSASPSTLQAFLQTRQETPVVVNLEAPPRGNIYEPPPQYAESDFRAVIDLIDS